jgi:hypothetical protein
MTFKWVYTGQQRATLKRPLCGVFLNVIRHTFIFLEKVGQKKEEMLWQAGAHDWHSFLSARQIHGISKKAKGYYDRQLSYASRALHNGDSSHFKGLGSEAWRLYGFFKNECVFLDIEVSGVSKHDDITMVGLYDGTQTRLMIRGINLDMAALKSELSTYKLIVTYNGRAFDLPFCRKRYPSLVPDIPDIDLRPLCQRLGMRGGLKEIEKSLNITRPPVVGAMYGGDPYRLWRMWRASGDDYYLRLFIEYNEQDILSLKIICEHVYVSLKQNLLKKIEQPQR